MNDNFYDFIYNLIKEDRILNYEWGDNKEEIIFKKKDDNGFDIRVFHDDRFIYIETELGYHDQFKINDNIETTLTDVMGLVRDLLSKNMRIVEILSNNNGRKWLVQSFVDNDWQTEHKVGLLIWNYFGKKSERVYSNDILLARELKD